MVGQGCEPTKEKPRRRKHRSPKKENQASVGKSLTVEVPLPVLGVLSETREAFHALCIRTGQQVLLAMMEADREALCGAKGRHQAGRWCWRGGSTASRVTLVGRQVELPRLRVRSPEGEVALASFQWAALSDAMDAHTLAVVERETGEIRQAQVFVAVLGASNYTFAEATWTQALPDWIASHVRAFDFFGGCSELFIPDNLRPAVSRAHRHEPDTHPTYHDLAQHYGVAVVPARVRKPRDKAKVEVGVQVVQRWRLAALRNRTFFSLSELNAAIAQLLEQLNTRPLHKLPGSRRSRFEQLDRPALRPLPTQRYVFAQWKKVRVNIDYHVEGDGHYDSVPHALLRRQLDLRLTANTVECLYRGQRVASHVRSSRKGHHTTVDEHMPHNHRRMGQWTAQRFIRWAEKVAPQTAALITTVLDSRRHPQQAFRSCLGILRLTNSYGDERLEVPAARALTIGAISYRSIESILTHQLDHNPSEQSEPGAAIAHHNMRGPRYYS